ncbi:MAG: hypothetical protein LT106_15810 [Burkholderiaceae bacterium]|nr:hypothetical protein [Burkholderiaceae bacterium]
MPTPAPQENAVIVDTSIAASEAAFPHAPPMKRKRTSRCRAKPLRPAHLLIENDRSVLR